MSTALLTADWATWQVALGVIFLVAVFLARTFLRAKNYRDRLKKTSSVDDSRP